ncbi:hypothetical protein B2J88_31370 [Rhodococcus sp. SRB_17]|nr:hypothetical protein [Rhodococcus sp. SRB_17]
MTETLLRTVDGLAGLWRRTLLIDVDGSQDPTAGVCWLQGPSLFVDLRLAREGRPVEGFAGRFVCEGDVFEWRRTIDLGPTRDIPDAATLHIECGVVVETGVHAPYIEHWVRSPEDTEKCWGAELVATDGSHAIVVRSGQRFGWAMQTPAGASISIGVVDSDRWIIASSSDPHQQGHDLALFVSETTAHTTHDMNTRTWILSYSEGDDLL